MAEPDRSALEQVWESHTAAEFAHRDPDAAVATITEDVVLVHVPLGIGGVGRPAVREFYAKYLTAQVPDDLEMEIVTRTVGSNRIIDEFIVTFTHTIQMDCFAPGIAPTGRHLTVPHVGVIGFRGGLISSEHIYWDHATVLAQLGLLEPGDLPINTDQHTRLISPAPSFEFNRSEP